MLFCRPHWAMVPPTQQAAVWATFRATKSRDERLRSIAYLRACADAVEAVAFKEGMPATEAKKNSYRRLVAQLEARAIALPRPGK